MVWVGHVLGPSSPGTSGWLLGSWAETCPYLQEKPPQVRPCQVEESSVEQAPLVEP